MTRPKRDRRSARRTRVNRVSSQTCTVQRRGGEQNGFVRIARFLPIHNEEPGERRKNKNIHVHVRGVFRRLNFNDFRFPVDLTREKTVKRFHRFGLVKYLAQKTTRLVTKSVINCTVVVRCDYFFTASPIRRVPTTPGKTCLEYADRRLSPVIAILLHQWLPTRH